MKQMRRSLLILAVTMLLLTLSACFEKDFDTTQIGLALGSEPVSNSFDIPLGTPTLLTATFPVEGATLNLTSGSGSLSIDHADRGFTLLGSSPGEYHATLLIEAKGYKPAELPISVTVSLLPLEAGLQILNEASGEATDLGGSLELPRGESILLLPSASADGAKFDFNISDESVAAARWQEDGILIEALYPGESVLTLTAEKENHRTARTALNVTVLPTPASLSLSQYEVSMTVGESRALPVSYQQGGNISLEYDTTGLYASQSGSTLQLNGLKPGKYTLSLKCSADGYSTADKTLIVTVLQPSVTIAMPSTLDIRAGEPGQVSVRLTPSDAEVTLSVQGGITASYQNGVITVSAAAAGSGKVEVTARRSGYNDATATLTITAAKPLPSVDTSSYSHLAREVINLTNAERQKEGLPALAYMADLEMLATVRSEEASRLWSHTRPDGRDFITVFDDYSVWYRIKGENLFVGNTDDPKVVVKAFMDSPGHRENILRDIFAYIGVGVYYDRSDGSYYFTQTFAG